MIKFFFFFFLLSGFFGDGSGVLVDTSTSFPGEAIATTKKYFAVLDVKPWSNETDMQRCEEELRLFKFEGLEWGECMAIFISYYK